VILEHRPSRSEVSEEDHVQSILKSQPKPKVDHSNGEEHVVEEPIRRFSKSDKKKVESLDDYDDIAAQVQAVREERERRNRREFEF